MCGGDGIRVEFLDNGFVVHAEGKEGKNGERSRPSRTVAASPDHVLRAVAKHLGGRRHAGRSGGAGMGANLMKPKGRKRKSVKVVR